MTSSSATAVSLPEASAHGAFGTYMLVAFDVPTDRLVADIRYVLRNDGSTPLVVFDRGTAHDIAHGQRTLGSIGDPKQEMSGEDLTLVHAAMPLPDPSPTSPPTPIAIELAPGATLAGRFQVSIMSNAMPKRVRWCVGVMPKDDTMLFSPQETKDGRLWTAAFAVVEKQQRVCTPWYDVQRRSFE
jgi:hypothetical protein